MEAFVWLWKEATKDTIFNVDPQRIAIGGTSASVVSQVFAKEGADVSSVVAISRPC